MATATADMEQMLGMADELIAHMTPGELVVPADILKQNPEVQELIFAEMRLMGIENPEQYIVGSEANSINPETGLPEFLLKKIFKGVKKAVKSVGKVLKKVAPIVLPIALNFVAPGLGTIAAGALGSGIGTLVQGGSIKDAFKSALIGGAMGGLAQGVSGGFSAMQSGQGFGSGFVGGLKQAGTDFMGNFSSGVPAGAVPRGTPVKDTTVDPRTVTTVDPSAGAAESTTSQLLDSQGAGFTNPQAAQEAALRGAQTGLPAPVSQAQADMLTLNASANAPRSTLQTAGDYMFRGGNAPAQIEAAQRAASQSAVNSELSKYGFSNISAAPPTVQQAAINAGNAAASKAGPGLLARFGPSVAASTALAYGSGFFDTPEQPEPYDAFEGQTRYMDLSPEERRQYQISDLSGGPQYDSPYVVQSQYGLRQPIVPRNPYAAPGRGRQDFRTMPVYSPTYAAMGGEMYPRRNGFISGPGTETSDDVPAMLSDGEFVLTAKAVRGAGNGSREQGVKNLYNMMSNFERMAS